MCVRKYCIDRNAVFIIYTIKNLLRKLWKIQERGNT